MSIRISCQRHDTIHKSQLTNHIHNLTSYEIREAILG